MNYIRYIINAIVRLFLVKWRMFIPPTEQKAEDALVSYAITVYNEETQLRRLLDFLIQHKRPNDEIVVQADQKKVTKEVKAVVKEYKQHINTYVEYDPDYNMAATKNHLNKHCRAPYIFQIDADEMPPEWLIDHLQEVIAANRGIELFKLPRINIFYTKDGTQLRDWKHWPDHQGRIYKNINERIHWWRPVHERIRGHRNYTYMPKDIKYALIHVKPIEATVDKWIEWKKHNMLK